MSSERPLVLLKKNYTSLSSHQKTIADFILANIDRVSGLAISELSNICHVSNTTVNRFLKKLGYESYPEFKLDLAREQSAAEAAEGAAPRFEDGYQDIRRGASPREVIHAVTASAASVIRDLESMVQAEDVAAVSRLMRQAPVVAFYGTGGSCPVAMDAFHKFMRLGLPVFFSENTHLTMIRIAHLPKGSVVVLFSHTGESREVLSCARLAREAGSHVVGVTSYNRSALASLSDLVLHSASYDALHYTDALVSRLVQLVLMDILFVTVSLDMEPESSERITMSRRAIASEKKRAPLR